jgi:EAL domain-containing protein (putative c-di-GMP-specific phosphodiesterase class I)/CHASE2 domain-containing sensor protein
MGFRLWPWKGKQPRGPKNTRRRLLVCATLFALVAGVTELGKPLDNYLRMLRDLARADAASGDIVVVAIDDRSLRSINAWPWPRRHFAALSDRLRQMGSSRVFFDFYFPSPSTAEDDRLFAEALERSGSRTWISARYLEDPETGARVDQLPYHPFLARAGVVNINMDHDFLGVSWRVPFVETLGGRRFRSMAAEMARVEGEVGGSFPIDYGIDYRTVPTFSASDILAGRVPSSALHRRTVVVAPTSRQLGDVCLFLGRSLVPCAYVQVLGAETLARGMPISIGWLPPFLATFAVALVALRLKGRRRGCLVAAGSVGALLVVPALLERNLIFTEIAPGLFLLGLVASGLAWAILKRIYRERGAINAVSGLPTLEALRQSSSERAPLLIAAKVQNLAEILSALPAGSERLLVEQIASRLTLGSAGAVLYQGDDGLFAWLAPIQASEPIEDQLDALHALFRSPVTLNGTPIDLTVRFGVDSNGDRSIASRLAGAIFAADEAAAGGLRWKRHILSKAEDATWKLSVLSQLDAAIDSGDLWVAYQPKLDLRSGRLAGAEALVRWTHPERGAISPSEFIPAAEQSNRIERLTYFVLDRALRGAAALRARGVDFSVAVNLSARLIEHKSLTLMVQQLLARHGVPPSALTLEVTETATLATQGARLEALEDLRRAGVQISIDDYGTGLSTLEYLKKVPAHEIKIDKSFIQAICQSQGDRLLVHSTIQLAHSLGRKVVAEGVEDRDTLDLLRSMNCDAVQGFLISKPLSYRDLSKALSKERGSVAA